MESFLQQYIHGFQIPLKNPVLIFSLILFIILLSPILLRKLNIPGIIGLIISGVIIGPHGLNILEKNSAVNLFSTIGLLYIMFIAGLELDLNEFKANKNKSFLFGFLTFVIPLSIGYPVCHYLLGYDFSSSFLTASMFATHTLVAYPIVSKLGISKNKAVAITVGGTILTDTAVLIILAVIIGSAHGSLNQAFWIKLGVSLVIFTAFMFLVIPRIAQWFFRKLESEKHSHYIFVLSVVFFAAFLAELAGVEPIIGAFVAGLALNKLIPHSSALMNRIEFIGNALFIPFFLISVGMLVDVSVLLKGPMAWVIAGTLSVVALSSKWLAALFTQLIFKFTGAQRQLIFGLSGAHAAATLAVILVGYEAKILDENILNGTIILILITCIVASFATEKAAKKIIVETNDETSVTTDEKKSTPKEQILLAIADLSHLDKLLELAIYFKDKKTPKPIAILTVVSNNETSEANILNARNKLEAFVKQASASESKVSIHTTIDHNPASGIVRISRELMADSLILGWPKKSSLIDKIMGKKIDNIIYSTDKNIFVCQLEKPLETHKKIIIVAPLMAEHEKGFEYWVLKCSKLAQELSASIQVYCNESCAKAIRAYYSVAQLNNPISIVKFDDWEDFLILSKHVRTEDLFIIINARKGAVSYLPVFENIPNKLEKHFAENNKILIYPQNYPIDYSIERFDDISAEPLNKGIETIQKIGKGIGNIFKPGHEEKEMENI